MTKVCLLLVGFEGDKKSFNQQRKKVHQIYQKHGAFSLGNSPGKSFEKGKYDFPYLRDVVMDYGITCDVSETATVWRNLIPLYENVTREIKQAIADTNSKPWCACHISHTYRTGASLYFTFGFKQQSDAILEQYNKVKHAAENAFLQYGGTLSHHHAVGYEHMPWIEADISLVGTKAVQGIKHSLDPKGIMNPGKIVSFCE
jgi:alkyldihydroxyacetonephosphate synthase